MATGRLVLAAARCARAVGVSTSGVRGGAAPAAARGVTHGARALHGTPLFEHNSDLEAELDAINEKFAEARDEIEYANEDADTTYFNESAEHARKVAAEATGMYEALLANLDEKSRAKVRRTMALKMEQLKAEVNLLDHIHA